MLIFKLTTKDCKRNSSNLSLDFLLHGSVYMDEHHNIKRANIYGQASQYKEGQYIGSTSQYKKGSVYMDESQNKKSVCIYE